MSSFDALPFCPEKWSDDPVLVKDANCLTYALGDALLVGVQTAIHAVPGWLSGNDLTLRRGRFVDCLKEYLEADGLIPTGDKIDLKPNHYPVALLAYGEYGTLCDFHFYRMNPDATWSHKIFGCPPKRVTRNGRAVMGIDKDYVAGIYRFVCFFNMPRDLALPQTELRTSTAMSRAVGQNNLLYLVSGEHIFAKKLAARLAPKRREWQNRLAEGHRHICIA